MTVLFSLSIFRVCPKDDALLGLQLQGLEGQTPDGGRGRASGWCGPGWLGLQAGRVVPAVSSEGLGGQALRPAAWVSLSRYERPDGWAGRQCLFPQPGPTLGAAVDTAWQDCLWHWPPARARACREGVWTEQRCAFSKYLSAETERPRVV